MGLLSDSLAEVGGIPTGVVLPYSARTNTFTNANVTTGTDSITISAHGYSTGMQVYYRAVSGTGPVGTGLVDAGVYLFIVSIDANTIKLATTKANALAGTVIDITATGTGTTMLMPVPIGYLVCNGDTQSRTTYSGLFAVIGTAHGNGDGSNTFHLPDYRGRFLRGVAASSANDPDASSRTALNTGGDTGDRVGTAQSSGIKDHTHNTTVSGLVNGPFGASGAHTLSATVASGNYDSPTSSAFTSGSPSAGVGGTENSRPINATVNYIIRI